MFLYTLLRIDRMHNYLLDWAELEAADRNHAIRLRPEGWTLAETSARKGRVRYLNG